MSTYLKNFSPILYDAPAPRTQNDIEIIDATITRSTGDGRIKTITFGTGDAGTSVTLTTTGTSGLATLISGVLNVPNYTSAPDRFGYPSEDDTATEDRTFDLDGNNMTLNSVAGFAINSGGNTGTQGAFNSSEFNISMVNADADLQSTSVVQTNSDGSTTVRSNYLLVDNRIDIDDTGIIFLQKEKDGSGNFATDKKNYFSLPNTADTGETKIKVIAATRAEDDFANDAAAATGGIGVGKYYHTGGIVKMRLV